jgi:hypothetical protein
LSYYESIRKWMTQQAFIDAYYLKPPAQVDNGIEIRVEKQRCLLYGVYHIKNQYCMWWPW